MISRLFLLVTLALVACSPADDTARFPVTPVGITAVIHQQSRDFDWEVTEVSEDIITTETYWNGERIVRRKLYRGLYPIYGIEYGRSFEIDFDHKVLDQLFPLEIGNTASFEGTLNLLEDNYRVSAMVHAQVTNKSEQQVGDRSFPVYIIEITSRFSSASRSDVTHNTLFYSPEIGVVLKSIMQGSGAQSFMRMRSIDIPDSKRAKKRRRNTSNTVLI